MHVKLRSLHHWPDWTSFGSSERHSLAACRTPHGAGRLCYAHQATLKSFQRLFM